MEVKATWASNYSNNGDEAGRATGKNLDVGQRLATANQEVVIVRERADRVVEFPIGVRNHESGGCPCPGIYSITAGFLSAPVMLNRSYGVHVDQLFLISRQAERYLLRNRLYRDPLLTSGTLLEVIKLTQVTVT